MEIFFSVGEPSGDQHAAHLIHELRRRRPGFRACGYGGPLMERAGCKLHFQLTDLAVMGFLKVVPLLFQFFRLVREANRYFRESRPDAVVLVDFPGFNWWIARKAKAAGIPVYYYMPPQLWAWASWRIRRVRKYVDCVLAALPFEAKWYSERGIKVEYVGHPFFDEVADHALNEQFLRNWQEPGIRNVGVLPGSRNHEIAHNWPLMIEVMQRLAQKHRDVRFLVACYKQQHRDACIQALREKNVDLPIFMFVGKTPEIIEIADCAMMVSGSVSLEMLARATPAIVMYRVGRFMFPLLRLLVHVKSLTLPNLIAGRTLLPEWLIVYRPDRDVAEMTAKMDGWLSDRAALEQIEGEMRQLRTDVVATGATARAAEALLARFPQHALRKAG